MAEVVLVRPDDQLVLGVRWENFTVSGDGTGPILIAGAGARLIVVLPPQHVGEESSPEQSPAPDEVDLGGGVKVPVWHGVVSGPTRLAVGVDPGAQIPLTADGVLTAVLNRELVRPTTDVPAANATAIELPWRLVIALRGRTSGMVVCRHLTRPAAVDSSGLWRTRLVDPGSAANTVVDADLDLTVVDLPTAQLPDPTIFCAGNTLPLTQTNRVILHAKTASKPARLSRLEFSAIGGTLDAVGRFDNFEWDHHAVLGRDMFVRLLAKGVMYPFGHRAELLTVTRRFDDPDPTAGGAAVLRKTAVLTIVEPVRRAPTDARIRRGFPLGQVEITRTVFTVDADPEQLFTQIPGQPHPVPTHFFPTTVPRTSPRTKVLFPVTCTSGTTTVTFAIPMLFVSDLGPEIPTLTSPQVAAKLAEDYRDNEVAIAPTNIDLAGAATEVRAFKIAGATAGLDLAGDGYRPQLNELEIGLPAMRGLLGEDPRRRAKFTQGYLDNGTEEVILQLVSEVEINFTQSADRSGGLVAPRFTVDGISRTRGPITRGAMPAAGSQNFDVTKLFPSDDATMLGIPLRRLLSPPTLLTEPPQITYTPGLTRGSAPEVTLGWHQIPLKTTVGPFTPDPARTKLDLTVTRSPNAAQTTCVVNNFALELPPSPQQTVLKLVFRSLTFTQTGGQSPQLDVDFDHAEFVGDLRLLEDLRRVISDAIGATRPPVRTTASNQPAKLLEVTPAGLAVRYSLAIPSIGVGPFAISNMAFTAGIDVPFKPRPVIDDTPPLSVLVLLGFASRANPFQLSVMMFGGGGYLEIELSRNGLERFEAALEFGAFIAMNFVIAYGEVHALGGVRFVLDKQGKSLAITGYLRIGGVVEVLGLISVSIELNLSLTYRSEPNALVGRATLVIEIDLTLWSDSVEIDSGEWVIAGGGPRALFRVDPSAREDALLAVWKEYRAAFAPRPTAGPTSSRRYARPDGGAAPRRQHGPAMTPTHREVISAKAAAGQHRTRAHTDPMCHRHNHTHLTRRGGDPR